LRDNRRGRIAAIAVAVLVVIVAAIGGWYWWALQPASHRTATITYTLAPGTRVTDVASQLQQRGIIRSATAFTWYVTATNLRRKLEAGDYDLNPTQSAPQIAQTLAGGRVAQHNLVIPEGSTVTQIRSAAAKQGISADAFNTALGASYASTALAGRPAGDTSLEGYLFPDTYIVKQPPNAQALVQTMLDTFSKEIDATDIPQGFAAQGLSLHQGLTLASVVEKEVSKPEDQAMVAQVFLNRIKAGLPLQSDVTVDYAAELTGQPFSTSLNSPYNTYLYKGLPPGPICNPGLGAMEAVAHPISNSYLYFVAGKDGVTHYATTYQQHEENVQLYLNQ
jgi:UPF0755 protein